MMTGTNMMATADSASTDEVVTFRVGDQWFGIPVLDVQEVINHQRVARVPLAGPRIAGLLNLRGQIVTAIDMHARLEISRTASESSMNVVVRDGGELFALIVDEVGDVAALSSHRLERLPTGLDASWGQVCTGIARMDQGLLAIVDAARLLNESNTRP
jgi:purine-binding chemotaxis protein CheW